MHSDVALARRLERTEARANADFVEARALRMPEVGACWIERNGAYAMFDGVGSPCTQTFGLGVFSPVLAEDMDALDRFFFQRGSPAFHEISPLADSSLLPLLAQGGYSAIEQSNVLFRPTDGDVSAPADVRVRLVGEGEFDLWAKVSAEGWREYTDLADQMPELGQIVARRSNAASFLAEIDGVPVAAGALGICEGVALLAGASTVPEARRRGAQLALLSARLRYAREQGCDLAMIVTAPGSGSQRNAERHGFHVAYTRTKWMKNPAG